MNDNRSQEQATQSDRSEPDKRRGGVSQMTETYCRAIMLGASEGIDGE